MSGNRVPPGGSPIDGPGDDEYGWVVFDDAFVRAARIREYSARERLERHRPAVADRGALARTPRRRQAIVLGLLLTLALGGAVYLGLRQPHRAVAPAASLRVLLTPLAPHGAVPAAAHDPLLASAEAAGSGYQAGSAGFAVPTAEPTADFSARQVAQALTIAREYLVASSMDVAALTGGDLRGVRDLLNPGQLRQFDRSLARPADDGRYAATGWLVRFDPVDTQLADPRVLVTGTFTVSEPDPGVLEVATDHTLLYTVRPAGGQDRPPSVFLVHRRLLFRFGFADLAAHQAQLQRAQVAAGPLACSADPAAYFHPLLAGQTASATPSPSPGPAGSGGCGTLPTPASGAQAGASHPAAARR